MVSITVYLTPKPLRSNHVSLNQGGGPLAATEHYKMIALTLLKSRSKD